MQKRVGFFSNLKHGDKSGDALANRTCEPRLPDQVAIARYLMSQPSLYIGRRVLSGKEPQASLEVTLVPMPTGCAEEYLILKYLREGELGPVAPGVLRDVLRRDSEIIGAPSKLSDGTWSWPGELAYYVERYHVRLPEEFVEHMRQNDWKVPVS